MSMRDEYAYHQPTPEQLTVMERCRQAFSDLHDQIVQDLPDSRYRSLAITELEITAFWTNKAIVLGERQNAEQVARRAPR
jgi:hypothetical protein